MRVAALLSLLLAASPAAWAQSSPNAAKMLERATLVAESHRLRDAGDLDGAIDVMKKVLALDKSLLTAVTDFHISALGEVAYLHELRRDDLAARTYRERELAAATTAHGRDHWRTRDAARALQDLKLIEQLAPGERRKLDQSYLDEFEALRLGRDRKFSDALQRAGVVLHVRRGLFGDDHPRVVLALRLVGALHLERGDYRRAEDAFKEAAERTQRNLGGDHPASFRAIADLARTDHRQGYATKAEENYRRVLADRRRVLGDKNLETAAALADLAAFYVSVGDYAQAEPLLKQGYEGLVEVFGDAHPDAGVALANLANVSRQLGSLPKAEALFRKIAEMTKDQRGEESVAYANALDSLAMVLRDQGDYDVAERLFDQSLRIKKGKVDGVTKEGYAATLSNLAVLERLRGAHGRAEKLSREVVDLYREIAGDEHPKHILGLAHLADVYRSQGAHEKAEGIYKQALGLARDVFGEKHLVHANLLSDWAVVSLARGDPVRAEAQSRKAVRTVAAHLDAIASGQSEAGQIYSVHRLRWHLDTYLSLPPRDAEAAYSLVLPWKGAVTFRQRLTRAARSADRVGDDATRGLFAELERLAVEYARLSQRRFALDAKDDDREAVDRELAALVELRERVEVDLAGRTLAFRKLRQSRAIAPEQLKAHLPEDAALIDFFVYTKRDDRSSTNERLLAFVVTKDRIRRVELGPLSPIRDAVDAFLGVVSHRKVGGADDPGKTLRDLVWSPLDPVLVGTKLVLIAPDGPLCRLPFAALPLAEDLSVDARRYLIEKYSVAILPVPQLLPELLAPRDDVDRPPSLLAVGDVDFDSEGAANPNKETSGGWKRVRGGGPLQWPALPGTRGELLVLEDLFKKAVPKGTWTPLKGKDATTAAVRKRVQDHEFLHLATHGFFAPRDTPSTLQRPVPREPTSPDGAGVPLSVGLHPGLLSGIVLAGANKPRADDTGVVTALEVAELNLERAELAVLSACETGLGETAGGEGVFGLQRAFQIAGARTTVTSLWTVDDDATRKLMELFYENYWTKNLGTLESLRAAQLTMLAEGVKRGLKFRDPAVGRTPPYYWAAFVLSGDWR